jgi:hypothetical protein
MTEPKRGKVKDDRSVSVQDIWGRTVVVGRELRTHGVHAIEITYHSYRSTPAIFAAASRRGGR